LLPLTARVCAGGAGCDTYEKYVDGFIDTVKPNMLSFDYYPEFGRMGDGATARGPDSRRVLLRNLEFMRVRALRLDVPLWMYITVVDYPGATSHCCEDHSDLTESQIRWQAYAGLVYGVRGIIYFTYGPIDDGQGGKKPGVVTAAGKPAPHYWQAQRLNRALHNLGPTMMQLRSTATLVMLTDADPDWNGEPHKLFGAIDGCPLRDITEPDNSTQASLVAGLFESTAGDNRTAAALFNYEHASTAWVTLHFHQAVDVSLVTEIDPRTGAEVPLEDAELGLPGMQIFFEAAGLHLLLFPAPTPTARLIAQKTGGGTD
jgi:hypothetical protein